MAGLILGKAYERGRGVCLVEQVRPGADAFRLIPLRNPNDRIIRHRSQIQWRKNAKTNRQGA